MMDLGCMWFNMSMPTSSESKRQKRDQNQIFDAIDCKYVLNCKVIFVRQKRILAKYLNGLFKK